MFQEGSKKCVKNMVATMYAHLLPPCSNDSCHDCVPLRFLASIQVEQTHSFSYPPLKTFGSESEIQENMLRKLPPITKLHLKAKSVGSTYPTKLSKFLPPQSFKHNERPIKLSPFYPSNCHLQAKN